MATKTRKIPQSHWDKHKDTILNLYLNRDLPMEKLIETMDHDHGFTATISQFEAQLRIWKARKNLRMHEWERVLPTMDSLASRGVKSRVLVSGHVVSMNKIGRARRYCQANTGSRKRNRVEEDSHDDITSNEDTTDVVIETQDSSGQWSQYTIPIDGDINASQYQTNSRIQQREHGTLSPGLQSFDPDFITANWFTSDGNEGALQPMDFSLAEYEAHVPQPFVQHEPFADNTFPNLELVLSPAPLTDLLQFPSPKLYLNNLPFEQFERDLALKRLQLACSPSPMQEQGLFSRVQSLANRFSTNAADVMTQANGKPFLDNLNQASIQLRTLHSIMPRVGQGEFPQITKEVELHRLLLYSSANGFMGLDGIPTETVFRFLNQHSNATSLLRRLFQNNPGHVVKSLAENLFRAAIESGDHNATRFFLETGLVGVDKTICIVNGQKYTPLERAAELQRLEVVKELLQFQPDVNKTFFSRKDSYGIRTEGVLGLLIIGNCPEDRTKRNHSPFSSDYLEVVDILIQAGVKIHTSNIYLALKRFVRMNLAKNFLRRLAPSDHSKVFSDKSLNSDIFVLRCIAEEFTDEEATEAIAKLLSDCEQTNCKRCLSGCSLELNLTIASAAKRGHIKLVRSLFQYAAFPTEILSAAIRSRNHELIEFVLAQNPAVSLTGRFSFRDPGPTTPLAEAIEAGDDMLIMRLESKGALENLDTYQFVCAFIAASKAGRIEYTRKLLQYQFKPTAYAMEDALNYAIENRQEHLVRLLLDVGVWPYNPRATPSLSSVYKLGNRSLLTDFMLTFPDACIYDRVEAFRCFSEFRDVGFGHMVEFFIQSSRITGRALTGPLLIAVELGDRATVKYLLESGADVMDNAVLEDAVDGHNDMLRILLERIPPTKTPVGLFGTNAVAKAINQLPSNIEALELLLACTAVDVRSIVYDREEDGVKSSPLCLAIQRDAASECSDFSLTTRLLDAGCNLDQIAKVSENLNKIRVNETAMLIGIQTKNNNMVQFLISRGADINKEAIHGIRRTPLQAAAEQGSLDIVELLLQKGANADDRAAQYHGATALQCAAMSGNCNIAATLLGRGASLYSPSATFHGRSPIEGAAEHGRVDMIQFLWNASLGFGFPVGECRRAMELAEGNGHMACRHLILKLAVMSGIIPMIEMSG